MNNTQIQIFFKISKKGRSKRAQALLQLLRERAEGAEYGYFTLEDSDKHIERVQLHTTREPGIVYYQMCPNDNGKLPEPLQLLDPLSVNLRADGSFNFPVEGLYAEGGAEVSWTSSDTNYSMEGPPQIQNSWSLTLTMPTLAQALDLYIRIREGRAHMSHQWIDALTTARMADFLGSMLS